MNAYFTEYVLYMDAKINFDFSMKGNWFLLIEEFWLLRGKNGDIVIDL